MNNTLKALAKMILWIYILNEKDLGCYCFRKVVHHKTNYKKIMEKWWRISWVREKGKMTTQKTFADSWDPNKRTGCWLNFVWNYNAHKIHVAKIWAFEIKTKAYDVLQPFRTTFFKFASLGGEGRLFGPPKVPNSKRVRKTCLPTVANENWPKEIDQITILHQKTPLTFFK